MTSTTGIGTTNKPVGRDERDIDLVCEMNLPATISQAEAKRLLGQCLMENTTYAKMLQEKNRCWRLIYAGEFHMDILPSKPDHRLPTPTALLVPDSGRNVGAAPVARATSDIFFTKIDAQPLVMGSFEQVDVSTIGVESGDQQSRTTVTDGRVSKKLTHNSLESFRFVSAAGRLLSQTDRFEALRREDGFAVVKIKT